MPPGDGRPQGDAHESDVPQDEGDGDAGVDPELGNRAREDEEPEPDVEVHLPEVHTGVGSAAEPDWTEVDERPRARKNEKNPASRQRRLMENTTAAPRLQAYTAES
jgi:hypothetical protein